jgi:phosphoserine aminotransferase
MENAIMTTTTTRVYNFSPGPAILPLPVLEEAQRDLVSLPGVGMSVLEISHRGKVFEGMLAECDANIRKLANIPANYKILFLQGGASTQFSMVPMNLLGPGRWADYIVNGAWGEKAIKDAKKIGAVNTDRPGLQADVEAGGSEADAGRRLRPHDVERDDPGRRVHLVLRHGRRAARGRYLVRHVQRTDRRQQARAGVRGCAEEHRAGGRRAGHHP